MGRKLHYVPGSFYRKDDRTGFPTRAERTKKEWNGYIVDEKYWEPRQPQDLVRGVKDDQTVPEARPLPPNQYIGPIYQEVTEAYGPGAMVLQLGSVAGMSVGDTIGVFLEDGSLFIGVLGGFVPDAGIAIWPAVPGYILQNALVVDYRTRSSLHAPYLLAENGNVILNENGQPLEIEF